MYEFVKMILDVSKERDVDISVAKDMLIAENREIADKLESAYKFIRKFYKFVTSRRVAGDEESIAEFCKLYELGDVESLREMLEKFDK